MTLRANHDTCVHESVESADLRCVCPADAEGRSLKASKTKLGC